jgi:hypothetical protein
LSYNVRNRKFAAARFLLSSWGTHQALSEVDPITEAWSQTHQTTANVPNTPCMPCPTLTEIQRFDSQTNLCLTYITDIMTNTSTPVSLVVPIQKAASIAAPEKPQNSSHTPSQRSLSTRGGEYGQGSSTCIQLHNADFFSCLSKRLFLKDLRQTADYSSQKIPLLFPTTGS